MPEPDWSEVCDLLRPAIAWDGEYSEAEVRHKLATREAQLWTARDDKVRCAVVTCIRASDAGPVCEIWLLGGEQHCRWLHFIEVIEAAAREQGCISVELRGRAGWSRLLPDYRVRAVVLRKAL